jgi:hypothetical protein
MVTFGLYSQRCTKDYNSPGVCLETIPGSWTLTEAKASPQTPTQLSARALFSSRLSFVARLIVLGPGTFFQFLFICFPDG